MIAVATVNMSFRANGDTHLAQLNIRRTVPQAVDPQSRQREEVLLLPARRQLDGEHGVADLLDDDGSGTEARLLRVVADELEAFLFVFDHVCGDRGVVRDLLREESGLTATVLIGPVAVKQPGGRPSQRGRSKDRRALTLPERD